MGYEIDVNLKENTFLSEALKEKNIYLSAPCGGLGICGKCQVKVVSGEIIPSKADLKLLSKQQIKQGIRLACAFRGPFEGRIEIINDEESMSCVGSKEIADDEKTTEHDILKCDDNAEFGIVFDIGTTTLVAACINLSNGQSVCEVSGINHQRAFGADVISRIKAANDGMGLELQKLIKEDIYDLYSKLINKIKLLEKNIRKIYIAGNTTMIHLLMGYECNSLGVYPFKPYNISTISGTTKEIIGIENLDIDVTIIPGISTFVGGDIVSDIVSVNMDTNSKTTALIDLGTNGEMAIGNSSRILVTSTSAGPAFEGGNISCGTGAVDGAICRIDIYGRILNYGTINNGAPSGICGSGVLEITRELLRNRIIDTTGLMNEEYEDSGYVLASTNDGKLISFTQKDVREVQLAKAAIRAGFETLVNRFGTTIEKIDKIYVAGGFGYNISMEKACDIGLFPHGVINKLEAIGNGVIKGTKICMLNSDDARLEKIINISEEVLLSMDSGFNDLYIEQMKF